MTDQQRIEYCKAIIANPSEHRAKKRNAQLLIDAINQQGN